MLQIFPDFLKMVETQYKIVVKAVRSDNAPELKFVELFKSKGIIAYHSCPETQEQNSVVERKHQHILNVARSLMFQSKIPEAYWRDCVLTAVFLINRLPTPLLKNESPYEVLTHKKPDYTGLRVFGSLCYSSTTSKNRNKFQPRARPCVFLGYPSGYKGYKLLDLETNSIHISRNVVFHETIFPFIIGDTVTSFSDIFDSMVENDSTHALHDIPVVVSETPDLSESPTVVNDVEHVIPPVSAPNIRPEDKRPVKQPAYLNDYYCNLSTKDV